MKEQSFDELQKANLDKLYHREMFRDITKELPKDPHDELVGRETKAVIVVQRPKIFPYSIAESVRTP